MNPYLPVLLVLVLSLVIGVAMTLLSRMLGPRRLGKVKQEAFECGVPATGSGQRMSIKYYLTAILFILFDIETVFLYLWAKTFKSLGWFGVIEILVFVAILITGYIYVLQRGALEWDS